MSRADLAWEDADDRCRSCGKRLVVDVGQDVFGHSVGAFVCINCGPVPQSRGWELELLAAVTAVTSRRTRT